MASLRRTRQLTLQARDPKQPFLTIQEQVVSLQRAMEAGPVTMSSNTSMRVEGAHRTLRPKDMVLAVAVPIIPNRLSHRGAPIISSRILLLA